MNRFNVKEDVKPKQDGAASLLIKVSNGGDTDPRCFYATSYGSAYRPNNSIQSDNEPRLNKSYRWNKHEVRNTPNCTGYKKNLLPYFMYDKAIDENSIFRIENAFETTQGSHFLGQQPSVSLATKSVVPRISDWRSEKPVLSSHVVELEENEPGLKSTQKADYGDPSWFYDAKHETLKAIGVVDGQKGSRNPSAPLLTGVGISESGWIKDCGHDIAGLCDKLPTLEEKSRSVTPIIRNVTRVGDTGFNRPDAKIPAQNITDDDNVDTTLSPYFMSHSRAIYSTPHSRNRIPFLTESQTLNKKASGAVKDWPDRALLTNKQDRRWDTSYNTCYNAGGLARSAVTVSDSSNRSGYSMCNKYEFEPFDARIEEISNADPMQERAHRRRDSVFQQRIGHHTAI